MQKKIYQLALLLPGHLHLTASDTVSCPPAPLCYAVLSGIAIYQLNDPLGGEAEAAIHY